MMALKYLCLVTMCLGVALEALNVISLVDFIKRREPVIRQVLDMVLVLLMIVLVSIIAELF